MTVYEKKTAADKPQRVFTGFQFCLCWTCIHRNQSTFNLL